MPRGRTPRQPARSGRQDRVTRAPVTQTQGSLAPTKSAPSKARGNKDARGGTMARVATAAASTSLGQASGSSSRDKALSVSKGKKSGRYNPLAPERISEILKRLDQLYPDVIYVLTHPSVWVVLFVSSHS